MADRSVEVDVQIGGEDIHAGRLWSHRRGSTQSATFAYAESYLAAPGAYALDPALPLVSGQLQTPAERKLFGALTDCAPDRWGRQLLQRGERRRARAAGESDRSFGEIDYLLGVRDELRQGALRFRSVGAAAYLADEPGGVPALVDLPELLDAAEAVERGDDVPDDALRVLLRAGSSPGGARPKAHVRDADGQIVMAKFPSPTSDDWDVMRWEAVSLTLAASAGITVPRFRLESIAGRAVLVLERFDRGPRGRIGYCSAMTMLELGDGDSGTYADLALVIEEESSAARLDLEELWRRVAFSILISNTDDHLRNHGFVRADTSGWRLSPAFDLNPDPSPGPKHLRTALDAGETSADIGVLLEIARPAFGLVDADIRRILADVVTAVGRWEEVARQHGLGAGARAGMAAAFDATEAEKARAHGEQ